MTFADQNVLTACIEETETDKRWTASLNDARACRINFHQVIRGNRYNDEFIFAVSSINLSICEYFARLKGTIKATDKLFSDLYVQKNGIEDQYDG